MATRKMWLHLAENVMNMLIILHMTLQLVSKPIKITWTDRFRLLYTLNQPWLWLSAQAATSSATRVRNTNLASTKLKK